MSQPQNADADLAAIMELLQALADYVLELPDGMLVSGKRVRAAQEVVSRRLDGRRRAAR